MTWENKDKLVQEDEVIIRKQSETKKQLTIYNLKTFLKKNFINRHVIKDRNVQLSMYI